MANYDLMLQDTIEYAAFMALAADEHVTSYLEIGSKWGGSLWRMAQVLPKGSRVVAVDKPDHYEASKQLEQCIRELGKCGFDAHLIVGDSIKPETVALVQKLAPFDLCFIDADHTKTAVMSDWANYGRMARLVAFHDIGFKWRPEVANNRPIEVPEVWHEIKQHFRHREFKYCKQDNGIGILWRH